jgi:cell division protein FtsL
MYGQKRPIENTHIIRERDRRRFRELFAVLSLGVPLGAFLLLFTWQNLEVIRLGREATRLQKTEKELQNANKNLRVEIEGLTSLSAVEQKAGHLGFELTDGRDIVSVTTAAERQAPPEPEGTR